MIRPVRALPAVLLLAALTACGTTAPAATPTKTVTAEPAIEGDTAPPPASADDDMTQAVVDLTWDQTSEADKNSMCSGIDLFGTEWAADQLRDGGGDDSLDWDRAAVIIEGKCQQR